MDKPHKFLKMEGFCVYKRDHKGSIHATCGVGVLYVLSLDIRVFYAFVHRFYMCLYICFYFF